MDRTRGGGTSLIPWRGDQGYTGVLPDVLTRAAEPSWGHEHEHCEPGSPAPHRPAVRHRVAAHGRGASTETAARADDAAAPESSQVGHGAMQSGRAGGVRNSRDPAGTSQAKGAR